MTDVIAIKPLADVDRRLKAELQVLRRKGAIRSTDWDSGSSSGGSDSRACSRCRAELGRIINRGAFCRACRLRVCKACREYSTRSTDWVCTICHKHMEIQSATGEWMNEYVRRPSRRRDNRVYVPPSDVIKRSIRRSWTISNPSPRWSSLRGSAELRAYSSLPRHQDHPPNLQLSPILKKRSSSPQARRLPSVDSVDSGLPLSPVSKNNPRGSNENVRSRSSLIPIAQRHYEALTHQQKRCLFSADSGVESLNSQDECSKPSIHTYQRRSLISEGINRNSEEVRSNQRRSLEESPNSQRRSLVGDAGMNRATEDSPSFHRRPLISDGINCSLDESPNFPRRSLITDGINRNSAEIRQESPYLPRRSLIAEGINRNCEESPFCQRRSLQRRQQVEYSGTSDSGGGTPPGARKREDSVQEDVEVPCGATVFRKVTVKRRRQDTRRLLENEEKSISEELPTSPSGSMAGDWIAPEEDIDRLVAIHQHRTSLSSLGPRSDSMASVYSGAGESRYGTVTVRGEVEFALSYNYKIQALEVNVKQCRDLAAVDVKRNRSDPYVKVYLLPDKSKSGKRKTKVKKHTLNPVFDETLKFSVALDSLESRTLWLTVWHSDMFGRNDFLGEVMMSLENKVFDDPSPRFYHLNERTEPFEDLAIYKGDIIIGLKFVPPDVTVVKKGKRSRGSLHVLVKEAKNLTAVKAVGTSDPFCKCYLLPDKGRSSKQKTPVVRRNCSPVWNYTFTYDDVSLQELSERCLELTVWDHDRLASNEFLGGLRFSLGTGKHYGKAVDWMDANGKELQLWQRMLERPNFWVEGCIALRPSLEQRSLPAS